ncbi:DUF2259 domain-containing protein [Sinorhizobium garamanticum]|uniref:DUF2259 domain-containing protein n=2 Tax=Sinorhizobium garamanticum TaxID=680247 RepID=A0ABY8D7Z6_9HYPH|nr:DUF2259 domain-containing protein [Sinorhizobium garamanticum]WEX87005.1 DUF2259 domain-containing protein [Sinorhizobium garamanticum]
MSMRTVVTTTLLAATIAAAEVRAGDFAALQPIGFSSDGNVFAFEEYGVQDGSGFPYSTIYVLDTRKDTFLPGAPVRAVIEKDGGAQHEARREAHSRAAPLIDAYRLADTPGILVAYNPVTERSSAAHTLSYDAFPANEPFRKSYALKLEEKSFEPQGVCSSFLKEVKGFRLVMTEKAGKPAAELLQEDTRIPESRRCPTGYRIGGVVTRINNDGSEVHVVMILVKSLGFEGSTDGRWIALPVRLPK